MQRKTVRRLQPFVDLVETMHQALQAKPDDLPTAVAVRVQLAQLRLPVDHVAPADLLPALADLRQVTTELRTLSPAVFQRRVNEALRVPFD